MKIAKQFKLLSADRWRMKEQFKPLHLTSKTFHLQHKCDQKINFDSTQVRSKSPLWQHPSMQEITIFAAE